MQQYSKANQDFLRSQNPDVTEVKSFKAWAAEGRRVKKGEKALQVWVPKKKKADPDKQPGEMSLDDLKVYFRRGNVFDISQTETQEEWEARRAETAAATKEQIPA